jgi:hypothetical protein
MIKVKRHDRKKHRPLKENRLIFLTGNENHQTEKRKDLIIINERLQWIGTMLINLAK